MATWHDTPTRRRMTVALVCRELERLGCPCGRRRLGRLYAAPAIRLARVLWRLQRRRGGGLFS